jgi:hypothetical protein
MNMDQTVRVSHVINTTAALKQSRQAQAPFHLKAKAAKRGRTK